MTLVSTLAPTVAALAVTAIVGGKVGLRELRRTAFRWRVPLWCYAAAVVIPVICVIAPIVTAVPLSPAAYQSASITSANQAMLSAVFIFAFLEEVGWTGFALPRHRRRYSPLAAAIILGMIHGLWHLPLWVSVLRAGRNCLYHQLSHCNELALSAKRRQRDYCSAVSRRYQHLEFAHHCRELDPSRRVCSRCGLDSHLQWIAP